MLKQDMYTGQLLQHYKFPLNTAADIYTTCFDNAERCMPPTWSSEEFNMNLINCDNVDFINYIYYDFANILGLCFTSRRKQVVSEMLSGVVGCNNGKKFK
jgi:hypothetical protein